mmetsp:Transcript_41063/g.82314  ORF Transcript_41063/g.82314 Transcript_41063/m.82314 type:complete len:99 (+) Transcript_41063:3-299(+)
MLRRLAAPSRGMCAVPSSFLAKAAAAKDASVLLGRFPSGGRFDSVLADAGFETTAIGNDGAVCALTVTEPLTNNYKCVPRPRRRRPPAFDEQKKFESC